MTQNPCASQLWPPRLPIWLLSSGLLLAGLLATSLAQVPSAITSDNTLGTTVTQNGRVYTITGGTRPGNGHGPNLFHSFDRFSVGTRDTARFTGPQTGIENILSRVTGGQQSRIYGRLQSDLPGANLYLLNPSGVVFGPNATLDVKGSFHVSTADVLHFADGATFAADLGANSTLTVASPTAFGFLRENPAGMALQGSTLAVPPGETVSVVGGDIEITGGTLEAPGGQVTIASVASPGDVILPSPAEPPGLLVDSFAHLGEVRLAQNALLDVSGDRGGTVVIRGGRLMVEASVMMANTQGMADGASLGVDLEISEDLVVTQGSGIIADVLSAGHAGDIRIHAGQVEVSQDALIGSRAFPGSTGDGGEVTITTGRLAVQDTAVILTATAGPGDGGDVIIDAPEAHLDMGQITTQTFDAGHAGDVTVETERLTLIRGARIGSDSFFVDIVGNGHVGDGAAGSVTMSAADTVELFDTSNVSTSTIDGAGGRVFISAPSLHLDGGIIKAITSGRGRTGDIIVEVDNLTVTGESQLGSASLFIDLTGNAEAGDGAAGNVMVSATNSVTLSAASGITALTVGDGIGGLISIATPDLILDGGIITSTTNGEGQGGNISITTSNLRMDGGGILATASSAGGAGNIAVTGEQLTIAGGSQIDSSTGGDGQGGTVTVTATDSITISSLGTIASNALGSGKAGTVSLSTPVLTMDGEASIEARTVGDGNAGDVQVMVERLILTSGAQIGTTSGIATAEGDSMIGTGQAGSVTVSATNSIVITGGNSTGVVRSGLLSQTASPRQETTGAEGETAGQIVVSTPRLIMDDGGRIAADTGGNARGGNIEVQVERLSLAGGAQITSGSGIDVGGRLFVGEGRGGSIAIRATDTAMIADQDSGLRSNTRGNGRGGDITLEARAIELSDGAILSADSSGSGDAGSIRIIAQDTFLSKNSTVTTEATQASGGDIQMTAQSLVRLQDSAITARVSGGPGTVGGNITIDPELVILERSQIMSNAFQGRGGNITVEAEVFLADPTSVVSAIALDSQVGIDGEVDIRAPVTNLSGTTALLPQRFTQATALLRQRCAERLRGGQVSSLVLAGRDGVPADPEGGLPSPLAEAEGITIDGAGHPEFLGRTFASSQGLVRDEDRGGLHIRGWNAPPFSQAAWDMECARW